METYLEHSGGIRSGLSLKKPFSGVVYGFGGRERLAARLSGTACFKRGGESLKAGGTLLRGLKKGMMVFGTSAGFCRKD